MTGNDLAQAKVSKDHNYLSFSEIHYKGKKMRENENDDERGKFENGAILLFKNAPASLEFGIDSNLWLTGPQFMGIKMIPPGVHLITCGMADDINRCSFVKFFRAREVYVVEWRADTEDLSHLQPCVDDLSRIWEGRYTLDRSLGPYPSSSVWSRLSCWVSVGLLDRLLPRDAHAFSAMSGSSYPDNDLLPEVSEPDIMFTRVDLKRSYPPHARGHELSHHSRDKSWLLGHTIDTSYAGNWHELLGELQLAFIILLYGQNVEGLEQWKRLIHLLTFSRDALGVGDGSLFREFIQVLECQLFLIPRDFFVDNISAGNFLVECLTHFAGSILFYCNVDEALKRSLKRLDEFLVREFKWNLLQLATDRERRLDDETDDDPP
eukprot:Partr_v1_DN26448_c0_g1_i1_m23969 putative AAR2 splicing factor homolog (S. cerevisiae)